MYIEEKKSGVEGDIERATASLEARLVELRQERAELRRPLDQLDDRIARSADPDAAADLQREYDRTSDDLRYELELITSKAEETVASISQLQLTAELGSDGEARIVQEAAVPLETTNAGLDRNLALGGVLGLLLGFGFALLAETRDTTIKSQADLAKVTQVPMLAAVPEAKKKDLEGLELSTITNAEGFYANAYHKVRSSLEFLSLESDIRSVLLTSAGATEGKTTSATNLALAFASVGKRTVLADVDFRRGRLHRVFGMNQSPGLSDVVVHGLPFNQVARRLDDPDLASLLVLSTGTVPPNSSAFVGTKGFLDTVGWLREQSDVLILDAPPLLAVSDAHTMAKHVDGVVLTVRAGLTNAKELGSTIEALRIVGAEILGIILVGVDENETYGRYYYYNNSEPGSGRRGEGRSRGSKDRALWEAPAAVDLTATTEPAPSDALGKTPAAK